MKTLENYKTMFIKATTGSHRLFTLNNGITFNAVKGVMREIGYYKTAAEKLGIFDNINQDMADGYIKLREFSSWEARQTGQNYFYCLTVKGCKKLYDALIAE